MNISTQLAQIELRDMLQSMMERIADRPWVAAIEFLLIACVVFSILRFLQGTRGARLIRAVLMLLAINFAVVWVIADRFGLERINALYRFFVLGVFLVSLVAFQAELRRILLRLGQGGWLRRWFRTSDTVVGPIVTAVERLSQKKIGALIAIERTGELGAVTETGVRLDAVVSAELIETIFWPATPLHDLGVVIHQETILAAGCQFPLAESGDLDRALGSRHRAALGMSQEVDAVVVVVSEETGAISVAIDGRLQRTVSVATLRSILAGELTTQSPKQETPGASGKLAAHPEKVTINGTR